MKKSGKVINFDEDKVYVVTDSNEFVSLERNVVEPIKGHVYTGVEFVDRSNQLKIISIVMGLSLIIAATLYFIFFSSRLNFIVTIDGNTKIGVNSNKIVSVTDAGGAKLTNEQFTSIKGNDINDGLILLFDLAYQEKILPPCDQWNMGKIYIYMLKDNKKHPIDFTKFKEYAAQYNYNIIVNRNTNTFD